MSLVEQYWDGVLRRLQIEVDVFNRLIGHSGEMGRENELSLIRILENLVPQRLGIGSGMVIDNTNKRSKQTDIIIFDRADQPSVMAQTTQMIYPIETVSAAVEIKTTLTASEVADCAKKKQRLRELVPARSHEVAFLVLAFNAWAAPETVAKHLMEMDEADRPDLLCVLDPGIVAGLGLDSGNSDSWDVFFTPLHQQSASGERQTATWHRPTAGDGANEVILYGSTYPVTLLNRTERIVGEPGRALLLFLNKLLEILASHGAISPPALSYYLDDTAREVLRLTSSGA